MRWDCIKMDNKLITSAKWQRIEQNYGINRITIRDFRLNVCPEIAIYQLYHDEHSRKNCQEGFIPLKNTETDRTKNPYQENLTILDVYYNQKWWNYQYIGFVSWRFKEKTKLEYIDIINQMDNSCLVYSLSPVIWQDHNHMYMKANVKYMQDFCKFIDSKKILPIKITGKKFPVSYCNYWVMNANNFKEYIEKYLMPVIMLFEKCKDAKLYLNYEQAHRGDRYKSVVFFLEGLLSVFLSTKDFKYIPPR